MQNPPYTLIYDMFDGENFGLYTAESVERIAGIIQVADGSGMDYYEGHAFNIPRLASRPQESLEEFADRLYFMFTSTRARTAKVRPSQTFDLFAS